MGKLTSGGNEAGRQVVSGTFTSTGQSGNATLYAAGVTTDAHAPSFQELFNIALWGTFVATMVLNKSFDGGTTWLPCCEDNTGVQAVYTSPVNLSAFEPENGVLYQWQCTSFTSGTVNYRISK